ncbi:uncharacterized protein LOC135491633 [Lineus longissimus]|uniref:uncharacterized protein LOC135491633 n=1 Tax=Lineus longissimus TaxID=88925 RepID=UPI00315CA3F5
MKAGGYRRYDLESLEKAYDFVISGAAGPWKASQLFGVPETTLRDRVAGRIRPDTKRSGPPTILAPDVERTMVEHIEDMARRGYGYTRQDIVHLGNDLLLSLVKTTPTQKPLSFKWYSGFMSRWPSLQLQTPRSLSMLRAKAFNKELIDKYYNDLKAILQKYNLMDKPELIYNLDETGVNTEHNPPRIVGPVNERLPAITSTRGAITTVLACGNAIGNAMPPYFVFAGKRANADLMQGAMPGAASTMSDNGWSNGTVFRKYITEHFLKYIVRRNDPEQHIILLYDGHKSHINSEIINWAKSQNIILFVLPPHTSHRLQPLDVACFGPFKRALNREMASFLRTNPGRLITRYDICPMVCKAYPKGLAPANLISSFKNTCVERNPIFSNNLHIELNYRQSMMNAIFSR